MKFRVKGADRQTGRDVAREYEAKTPESATAFANLDGMVVAEVEMISGRSDPLAAPVTPPAVALSYRVPTTVSAPVPYYAGLRAAGAVLRVYAVVGYVLAISSFAFAAWFLWESIPLLNAMGWGATSMVVAALAPTFALSLSAAVTHGLSAACVALRDIARNSWR